MRAHLLRAARRLVTALEVPLPVDPDSQREQTVPDYLQARLAAGEEQTARNTALLRRLLERQAELNAEQARVNAELAEQAAARADALTWHDHPRAGWLDRLNARQRAAWQRSAS